MTGALTALADRAVQLGLTALVAEEIARGKLPGVEPEDAADAAGMFVLAMGKMGARELNYSSDIDLIVLFDETRHDPDDYADLRRGFIRVTQRLVKLLSEVTAEGYVFRTDLRLRPDPSVTPVCIATEPAEHYYESLGRTWERAAYIKARACAGAIAAGEAFLERLRPFVWRRHLDFWAIQDAQDMRLRIRAHKGLAGPVAVPGHDLKLGQGGIREIEFFTQTRQLIVGGRDAGLRQRATLPALAALADRGWVDREVATRLTRGLCRAPRPRAPAADARRRPDPAPARQRGRARRGSPPSAAPTSVEAFSAELAARLETVTRADRAVLRPRAARRRRRAGARGDLRRPRWPRASGSPPGRGCRRSAPTGRAAIFRRLQPELMRRIAEAASPDAALLSLDAFLARLPSGVQLFALMEANPPLLDLLVDICGTAPRARALPRRQCRRARRGDQQGLLPAACAAPPSSAPSSPSGWQRVGDYETALNAARDLDEGAALPHRRPPAARPRRARGGRRRLFRRRRRGDRRALADRHRRVRRRGTAPRPARARSSSPSASSAAAR